MELVGYEDDETGIPTSFSSWVVHHHPLLSYNIDSYGYKREYYPESFLGEFSNQKGKESGFRLKNSSCLLCIYLI